jgi:hypothetical protein
VYIEDRLPLDMPDASDTICRSEEHDLKLLQMWLALGQPDFPIDPEAIGDSDERDADEAASKDDSCFVRPNSGFQADADALLRSLLRAEAIDVDRLRVAFVSLKNSANRREPTVTVSYRIGSSNHSCLKLNDDDAQFNQKVEKERSWPGQCHGRLGRRGGRCGGSPLAFAAGGRVARRRRDCHGIS